MGLHLFGGISGSSLSNYEARKQFSVNRLERICSNPTPIINPNPDPSRYSLLRMHISFNWIVLQLQYLNCTNYEGKKILVFKDVTFENILDQKLIDPHFSDDKSFISPFARFEPTEEGWNAAIDFIRLQNGKLIK